MDIVHAPRTGTFLLSEDQKGINKHYRTNKSLQALAHHLEVLCITMSPVSMTHLWVTQKSTEFVIPGGVLWRRLQISTPRTVLALWQAL